MQQLSLDGIDVGRIVRRRTRRDLSSWAQARAKERDRIYQRKRMKDPIYRERKYEAVRRWKAKKYEEDPLFKERESAKQLARIAKKTPEEHARHLAQMRAWREKNRKKQRENVKRWHKANPEYMRAFKHARRAKLNGCSERWTAAELAALRFKCGKKCAHCGKRRKLTIDHIIPIAKGGSNSIRNIQFLCVSCNSAKHDRDPIDFARSAGRLL